MEYKEFKGIRKLGYCSGIITESLLYNMFYTYYLVFLTECVQLKPLLASTISLISVLWDAITDPIIGYYADKQTSDKRKFMLKALFPMAITFIAAFIPLGGMPDWGKFIFYVAMTMLFWLFYTVYTIPYYAVVAEITEDYDERTSIRGNSSLINVLAIAGGNIVPSILPGALIAVVGSAAMGWFTTAIIMSAVAALFGVLTVLSLRSVKLSKSGATEIKEDNNSKATDIFKSFLDILKLKPFKAFVVFIFFFLAASSMLQTNIVYMIKDCLKLDYDKYVAVFIIGLVATMGIVIPIVTKIAEKTDRRITCIIFFSITFAGLIVTKIIGLREGSIAMLVTQPVFMGIAGGAFWTLFYSMAYDLVEIDEFSSGKRRESIITAFPQFIQKFGAAIGMWSVGLVLQLSGYTKGNGTEEIIVQSARTVNGIENISTLFPALLLGISILGLILYPVRKENFKKLTEQLEKKRKGEEYSTDGFEKLV